MVTIQVDTRQFNKVFDEYMRYTSRTLVEAVNQHAYYIAKHAINNTPTVEKEKINTELRAMSRINPKAPLAAILVNRDRKEKGKKGLTGIKLSAAIDTYIRKRQSYRHFLRSGWIPAIRELGKVVKQKNAPGVPNSQVGIKVKGKDKGGATIAKDTYNNYNPFAVIYNAVKGSRKSNNPQKVMSIIEKGAVAAIKAEIESMKIYILNKLRKGGKTYFN